MQSKFNIPQKGQCFRAESYRIFGPPLTIFSQFQVFLFQCKLHQFRDSTSFNRPSSRIMAKYSNKAEVSLTLGKSLILDKYSNVLIKVCLIWRPNTKRLDIDHCFSIYQTHVGKWLLFFIWKIVHDNSGWFINSSPFQCICWRESRFQCLFVWYLPSVQNKMISIISRRSYKVKRRVGVFFIHNTNASVRFNGKNKPKFSINK